MILVFFSMFFYLNQNDTIINYNEKHIYFLRNTKIDSVSMFDYKLETSENLLGNLYDNFVLINKSSGNILLHLNDTIDEFINQDLKFRNHSQTFIYNDTIYRYGGYGFNQTNNTFQFFNFEEKKWFYLKNNVEELFQAPFNGNHLILNDKIYFLGGYTIDYRNGLSKTPYNIKVFDLKKRKFINKKFKELDFLNNRVLGICNTGIYYFDNSLIYYLNIDKNNYKIYYKPEKLSFITNSNSNRKIINDVLFAWNKKEEKIKTYNLNEIFNDNNLVFEGTIINSFDKNMKMFLSILFCILLIILFWFSGRYLLRRNKFIIKENMLIFNNNNLSITKNESEVLNILISKNQIKSMNLLKIIYNENLSYGQNERVKINFIKNINEKLKFVTNSKNDIINPKKNRDDRREIIYYINK